ncbi:LPD25 domain-containing protein [Fusobacterium sp.]|uniref:LPD25 domain-containing protein n=1 Tax=Fusobacterium sp. TaxID=68766 RepID=UPI0029003853|nr:LPD25 domain-containing protein [Fusobacterium sp.]MDU1912595.1 LPD25 domain-containing protein [Fusobacterium sp.]
MENKPLTKPLDKLQVIFHWSENDFGLAEETSLRGEKAYNFIKQLMDYDKEKNKERETNEKSGYDKTKISLYYGGECIKEKIRIDLGDLEFGKDTQKVSDGLEYRLMLYVKDVRDNAHEYSEMSEVLYGEKMKDFRERENKYLKSKDQEVEKEKASGKKNPWAKPKNKDKESENER